eukprot:TRINITY_DN7411_c0_g1_i1.p1 TRINITY_DN7411_c0_g1~~TRINITY_DN7411_c0_g1_i1.p1  ORF type:complete len:631 (+),score=53.55 TRINITY_DN7411_c0_g1_i1:43-1935(+)
MSSKKSQVNVSNHFSVLQEQEEAQNFNQQDELYQGEAINTTSVRKRRKNKKKEVGNNNNDMTRHSRNHSDITEPLHSTLESIPSEFEPEDHPYSQPTSPTLNLNLKKAQSSLGLRQQLQGQSTPHTPTTPNLSAKSSPTAILEDQLRRRTYDGTLLNNQNALEALVSGSLENENISSNNHQSNIQFDFWQYFQQEINPIRKGPERDIVWGQTERDRVYSAICKVPYQFELLMWFGMMFCNDSFLSVFALIPYRAVVGIIQLIRRKNMRGDQLFDIVILFVMVISSWLVISIEARTIYYWIKDVTSEFLKLHALHNLIVIIDMISGNFAKDTVEALSGTCTLLVINKEKRLKRTFQLIMDTILVILFVTLHAATLMSQGLLFIVTLTSSHNMLIALLIASNFYEIKGTVFKKWNETRLEQMALMDVLERWHLGISMIFVVVEHMKMNEAAGGAQGGSWRSMVQIQQDVIKIYGAEVFIDVVKHSVLAKFNNVNPGMYREYIFKLCGQAETFQSHNIHHIIGFDPLGPAVFMVRIIATYLSIGTQLSYQSFWQLCFKVIFAWIFVFVVKFVVGYGIKWVSKWYQQFYESNYGTKPRKTQSVEKETQQGNILFRMQWIGMSIVLLQLYYFFRD